MDYRGLVQSTWVGTSIAGSSDGDPSDGGANGMTKVTDYAYNADGDVTSMTEYPGGTAADEITDYGYDSRDRLLWAMTYDGTNYTYTYNTYDNLGDVTKTQTYQAAAAWTVNPAGDTLLAESTTAYDTLGQVYQSSTYVEDTTQTPPTWTAQTTNYYYDADGYQVKLTDPDGNQTTWQYNGLGEVTAETNALDASDYYYYDGTGELSEKIDADGRATVYAYDGIGRETSEKWYTQHSVHELI